MTFVDLFSGIGGFRRGMELAGHTCVGFCEYDKYAVMSYTAMHLITDEQREKLEGMTLKQRQKEILRSEYRNGEWYASDIRSVDARSIPRADCWCFGFPCQDISNAGRKRGLSGSRSGLFFAVTRLIRDIPEEDRPRFLFIENVAHLLSIDGGGDLLRIFFELDEIGYDAQWQLLNSKNFGVPQNRNRLFIVANLRSRGRCEVFPIAGADGKTHAHQIEKRDHNGKMPHAAFVDLNKGEKLNVTDTAHALEARYDKGVCNHKGETSGVMVDATDFGAGVDTIWSEEHQRYVAIRKLTPKECFRLQGWTDDYFERAQLVNSNTQLYKQAGNGVTVNVIRAIAERIAIKEESAAFRQNRG